MNQAELISAIAGDTGHSKTDVKLILDELADKATSALMLGDEVSLPGIGKLKVKTRGARTGRNPATGEEVEIPEKRTVKLFVAKVLKDSLA